MHWEACRNAVDRFVRFRISNPQDAEDVLQEVYAAACASWPTLRDPSRFRAWVIGIARNKCADILRRHYRIRELPLDSAEHLACIPERFSPVRDNAVLDTLEHLKPRDQEILRMVYWLELPQTEIARRLGIPSGTVKSRLHHARERFRAAYPMKQEEMTPMSKSMPKYLPAYTITPSSLPPFSCKWEELMGWFIVPRLGEKLTWAMYDQPDRIRTEVDALEVTGRASVHGEEGVEIVVHTNDPMEANAVDDSGYVQRAFVAQLTDTHCRILSETHTQNGVKHLFTYLDGDEFLNNWGFGPDNCGNETTLCRKGDITREGSIVTTVDKPFLLDVVGRYTVSIGGKSYDTICVMDVETYTEAVSEQYIDQQGRTILWRRFNADNWRLARYGRRWSEMLPDSDRLTVNGRTFVHWYDCITSYIL